MPQKKKDVRKRTKKPGKIADLPAKSLKSKDAAAVKGGGLMKSTGVVADGYLKIEGLQTTNLTSLGQTSLTDTTLKISQ